MRQRPYDPEPRPRLPALTSNLLQSDFCGKSSQTRPDPASDQEEERTLPLARDTISDNKLELLGNILGLPAGH